MRVMIENNLALSELQCRNGIDHHKSPRARLFNATTVSEHVASLEVKDHAYNHGGCINLRALVHEKPVARTRTGGSIPPTGANFPNQKGRRQQVSNEWPSGSGVPGCADLIRAQSKPNSGSRIIAMRQQPQLLARVASPA